MHFDIQLWIYIMLFRFEYPKNYLKVCIQICMLISVAGCILVEERIIDLGEKTPLVNGNYIAADSSKIISVEHTVDSGDHIYKIDKKEVCRFANLQKSYYMAECIHNDLIHAALVSIKSERFVFFAFNDNEKKSVSRLLLGLGAKPSGVYIDDSFSLVPRMSGPKEKMYSYIWKFYNDAVSDGRIGDFDVAGKWDLLD